MWLEMGYALLSWENSMMSFSLSYFLWLIVSGEVCTPRQLVIMKDPSSIPDAVIKAGLTLPLGELFIHNYDPVIPQW